MKRKWLVGAFVILLLGTLMGGRAQDYAPPPAPSGPVFSPQQLQQMVGPIALYPDPLVAQVLAACNEPGQIAVAYTYVNSGGDPNGIDQQNWDPSIKGIAHYPDVLKMLNDNLPWATQLGQANINQPSDVMNAIQALRAQAQQLGNLQNLPQDNIVNDDGQIEIMPSDPGTLYVPEYDPSLVFYTPCYGRPFITFGIGFPIGVWLGYDFDWHSRHIIGWDRDHPRPADWWRGTPARRREYVARAPVFRPPAREMRNPAVYSRGDRGYAAPPREVRPAEVRPQPGRPVEVHPQPTRPVEVRPQPTRPAPVRPEPVRPVPAPREVARPSAFPNESAGETRAASSRGSESRSVSAPPARSSGGGGGGGGGGGRKR